MTIDFRTHPVQIAELVDGDAELPAAIHEVFGFFVSPQPLSTYLGHLDAAGMTRAVVMGLDCRTAHGATIASNDQLAELCGRSDRLIGFASVDPAVPGAVAELRRAVTELGLRGLSLDPGLQGFDPAGAQAAELFAACAQLRLPVAVQLGLNWAPRACAVNPLVFEPALAAQPDLRLVIAHCGWPWVAEAVMLAVKYPSVRLDTSVLFAGTPETSVGQVLGRQVGIDVIEGGLANQILFASDYPRVDPKRVRWAVEALGLTPLTTGKMLGGNAERLLAEVAA